jgi:transporter family protein
MEWLIYALLATMLITAVNFGDKFVVETQVRDPQALMTLLPIAASLIGLLLWGIAGFGMLTLEDALPLMLSGATIAGGMYFYFQAMQQAETTRIILLLQIEPLQVLILSMIFLNERLTPIQFLGFALILGAVIAAAAYGGRMQSATQTQHSYRVPILMMLTTIIWAIGVVAAGGAVDRVVKDMPSLLVSIAYTNLGFGLAGLTLYVFVARIRHAFHAFVPHINRNVVLSLLLLDTCFTLRQLAFYQALSLGPVSLVTVVSGLNIFFGIFVGWLLTIWKPGIFQESISRRALGIKFVLASLAFAGLALLG